MCNLGLLPADIVRREKKLSAPPKPLIAVVRGVKSKVGIPSTHRGIGDFSWKIPTTQHLQTEAGNTLEWLGVKTE